MSPRKSNEVPYGSVTMIRGDEAFTFSCIFEAVIPPYGMTMESDIVGEKVHLTCQIQDVSRARKRARKKKRRS